MSLRERIDRLWPSLVALAGTVAVVLGLLYFFGDDTDGGDDGAADRDASETSSVTDTPTGTPDDSTGDDGTDEPTSEPTETGPVTAPPELVEPVGVLNSTAVAGLAARAEERFEAGGWGVVGTGDYTQGDVTETTIYYPSEDMRASADAFAAQFPEVAVVALTPTGSNINRDHPVVILAQDYADAVGDETGQP